jgi:hypothetical protein
MMSKKLLMTQEQVTEHIDSPDFKGTGEEWFRLYEDLFGHYPETYGRHWPECVLDLVEGAVMDMKPFNFKPFPKGVVA